MIPYDRPRSEGGSMEQTWTWSTTGYNFVGMPHDEIIATCTAAGLSGIEGAAELFPDETDAELEQIARRYRDAGLGIGSYHLPFKPDDDIVCLYETTRRAAVDTMISHMERAAALGARVVIQHPSTNRFNVDLEGFDNYLRRLGRSLEALLPRAASLGLVIAIENMLPGADGPRVGSRPEHLSAIGERFADPNLGFCLDTGHALVAGGPDDAGEFFRSMAPMLAAFHLADNAGDRDSHLAPGRGLVDWDAIFAGMAAIGYAHPACIETPPFAHRRDGSFSRDAWKKLVAETQALADHALR